MTTPTQIEIAKALEACSDVPEVKDIVRRMALQLDLAENKITEAYNQGIKDSAAVCHSSIQPSGPYFNTLILSKLKQ